MKLPPDYDPANMLIDIQGTLEDMTLDAGVDATIYDYAQAVISMLNKHYVRR